MSLLLESKTQEINNLSLQLAALVETNSTLEKDLASKQKTKERSNNQFTIHKKSIEDLRLSLVSEIFEINQAIRQTSQNIQELTKLLSEKENAIASLENKLEILNPPELENIGLPSEWKYMECNEIEYEAMSPRIMETIYKKQEDSEESIPLSSNEELPVGSNLIYEPIDQAKIELAPEDYLRHRVEQNNKPDKISSTEEIKEPDDSIEYPKSIDSKLIYDNITPSPPDLEAPGLSFEKVKQNSEKHLIMINDQQEPSSLGSLINNRYVLDANPQILEHNQSASGKNEKSDLEEQQLASVSVRNEEIILVQDQHIPSGEEVKTSELTLVETDKELSRSKAADNIKDTKEFPAQKKFFAKYQPKVIPKRFQLKKAQDDDFFDELAKP